MSGPTRAEKQAFWGIMTGGLLVLLAVVAVVAALVWLVIHYIA